MVESDTEEGTNRYGDFRFLLNELEGDWSLSYRRSVAEASDFAKDQEGLSVYRVIASDAHFGG